MPDLTSRPYHPDPKECCERCVFGCGQHAEWCPVGEQCEDEIRAHGMSVNG